MAHKLDGFVKQINLLGKQIMINVMGLWGRTSVMVSSKWYYTNQFHFYNSRIARILYKRFFDQNLLSKIEFCPAPIMKKSEKAKQKNMIVDFIQTKLKRAPMLS